MRRRLWWMRMSAMRIGAFILMRGTRLPRGRLLKRLRGGVTDRFFRVSCAAYGLALCARA